MKKTIIIPFIFFAFFVKAQNEILFENIWYLQKIIKDDIEYITPVNDENSEVSMIISENYFSTNVCNSFGGSLAFHATENSFTVSDVAVTLMDCELIENFEFESLYFWEFFYNEYEPAQPYVYAPEDIDDYKELTITNSLGIKAIYHNKNTVSIPEISNNKISVFPNPAREQLAITFPPLKEETNIQILNIHGKIISEDMLIKNQTQYIWECKNQASGIYFYQIAINENRISGKLIVK